MVSDTRPSGERIYVIDDGWMEASHLHDYLFIRLGLKVALTHQHRSYRDSETKEKVETQKGSR